MNRITYIFIAILLSWTISFAQDNQVKIGNITVEEEEIVITDEYLDSVDFKKKTVINDYTMIGLHYGMALNR